MKVIRELLEAQERLKDFQARIEAIEARLANLQVHSEQTVVVVTANETQ
jgi:hypothetical protein